MSHLGESVGHYYDGILVSLGHWKLQNEVNADIHPCALMEQGEGCTTMHSDFVSLLACKCSRF